MFVRFFISKGHLFGFEVFVSQDSLLGFGRFLSQIVPFWVWKIFRNQRPSLGFYSFCHLNAHSFLGLKVLSPKCPSSLVLRSFFPPKAPHWVWKILSSNGLLLVFHDFHHPKGPPCVRMIFRHQGSLINFSWFLSSKDPFLGLEDFRHQLSPHRFEDFFVTQGSLLSFHRFVTQGSSLRFRRCLSPKDHSLGLEDFLVTQWSLHWFCRFVTQETSCGFQKFFILKGPPWVSEVLSSNSLPLCFTGFCHPSVLSSVLLVLATQGSLRFHWFLSTKGPPLGFQCFHHPRVLFGFVRFFTTNSPPLGFQVFVTQRSTLGFRKFLTEGTLLRFCWFLSPKNFLLGFQCFHHPSVPPWILKIFCHHEYLPVRCPGFCHPSVLYWVLEVLQPKVSPLCFTGFCVTKRSPLIFQVFRHPMFPHWF